MMFETLAIVPVDAVGVWDVLQGIMVLLAVPPLPQI